MPIKIKLSELPLFEKVPGGYGPRIAAIFKVEKMSANQCIIKAGASLPGLYLIIEGSVNLIHPHKETVIETIDAGDSFGEMALTNEDASSFTITSGEDGCRIAFLDRNKFSEFLLKNRSFAAVYYKNVIEKINQRLSTANIQIQEETSKLKKEVFGMMQDTKLDERLKETQMTVNKTGAKMFNTLADLIPELEKLRTEYKDKEDVFKKMKDEVQEVLLIDSQNFDLISQQIDIIHKYILNIQRFLLEQKLKSIHGDFNIKQLSETSKSADDMDNIDFF